MSKQTALIIAPGRGSYQNDELGYFVKHHGRDHSLLKKLDEMREGLDQIPISDLDQAKRFTLSKHTNGENASLLIYACAMADFLAIDRERYDIVAIAGNSMGWYLSLACAGALSVTSEENRAAHLINHMGTLMHKQGVGGQIIYPIVNDDWQPDHKKTALIDEILQEAATKKLNLSISIRLGGMIVLAGDKNGLAFAQSKLPQTGRYPMALSFHAAFHSSLLDFVIPLAQEALPIELFSQPQIPMIDGRGNIWSPQACSLEQLYDYTLGTQINQTYDFTKSVETGLKEFSPDKIIILGPGATMGPPVAQTLIANQWRHKGQVFQGKKSFKTLQEKTPFIVSMGIEEQRKMVVS